MEPQDLEPEKLDVALLVDWFENKTTSSVSRLERQWAGLRTLASDDSSVVGEDPDAAGFWWLAGQGGLRHLQPEINSLDTSQLGAAIDAGLNVSGITLRYTQPLMAGGIYASANDYSPILRAVLKGQLGMVDALGTNAVCAWVGAGCHAANSPAATVHWHCSIAPWVEDDPATGEIQNGLASSQLNNNN